MPDFEQLLQQNRHRFIAIANAYARHDDRDDLLQEILLQVWRGLSSYRGQAALATWCYRVALNTALGWQRSAGRRSTRIPISDSEVQTVADRSSVSDPYQMLQQFMRTLSDIDRACLLMYLDNFSSQDIAETFGVTDGAMRVRIHRIQEQLMTWTEQNL